MFEFSNNSLQPIANNSNAGGNSLAIEPEEKIIRQLPDILKHNLDMVVVGITPSGALGISNHHFSGPGNHFWRCIYEVGIVPISVTCEDDFKMLDFGIGFISFCTRPSKGGTELSRKEMKAGAAIMVEKIKMFKPKIVVFNGIGIYEAFLGNKNFSMGLQPNRMDGTDSLIFVMPSSSARCAQLPRAEDKIPFFVSLKKLRDHLKGELPHLEEKEVIFENYTEFRVTQPDPRSLLKAERRRKRKAEQIAETAQLENNSDNVTEIPKLDDPKPPIDHIKEEKAAVQHTISLSISNSNSAMTINSPMMTSSPMLSWPHNGGLTIIHTGQQILMPTVTQSATTNTLLLFDPNGLSFSPIPVPLNQTHLQVRPMIISSNETDVKQHIGQQMVSFAQKSNEPIISTSSTISSSSPVKSRHGNDHLKPISIKSIPKTSSNTELSKPLVSLPVPIMSAPPKLEPIVSNIVPIKVECEAPKEVVASPVISNVAPALDIKYSALDDPTDDWELFIKGINTGDFAYPAPPQAVPILSVKIIEEFNEVSQSMCRVLTVL